VNLNKAIPAFILMAITNIALSQVNTFPYTESFEQSFTTGTDIVFISNWTGNDVRTTSRIFQGSDARTGSASINVIPTSSFSGEIQFALDLTGINNPKIQFYAYSKQNGSVTSTRPATVSFSTSVDGGSNFLDDTAIGDETTFPNDNTTSYNLYEYELPVAASDEPNVVVLITVGRGDGSGSVAEFVMDDLTVEEQLLPLEISSVSAPTSSSVIVTFNQEVTQASAETIANYQINNGISISAASRTAVNEVTLSTSVMANNNYTLTVNDVEDAANNTPAVNLQDSYTFAEALSITSTTVTNKNSLEILFNLELDETSAEALTNYAIDNSIGNPTAAVLDAANAKKVTLTLGTDLTDNSFTLTVDNVQDASTLSTASGLTDMFSYLPLEVSTIEANSNTEIRITFNQGLAPTAAADPGNYSLNFGFGSPDTAVPDAGDASIVTLTFSDQLVNNTYTLSFSNITNLSGNANADGVSADLTYTTATLRRQIVINEIFADPTGSGQPDPQVLPGGSSDEFIELYNTSGKAIHLGDFDLTGGTIGDYVLAPGSYVILTATSSVSDYQGFGDVVGVTSWNGLSNSGEQIVLKDNLGNIVDSLTYNVSWYQDEAKSDGGWTIEQVNPELVCSDANNWIASNDVQGGTPGTQNTVFDTTPDTTGPHLLSVTANTDQEIVVTFNEIMDESSLTNGTYTLSDGISVTTATANSPGLRSVTLTLSSAMVSGAIYNLTATGVTDCAGNAVNVNALSFLFDDQPPVFQRFVFKDTSTIDLIFDEDLNETIAETESNFSLDQGIGNPASAILNSENSARIRLEFDQALEEGAAYSLTYENLTDTLGNSISSAKSDFTFTNAIDTVIVVSSQLLDVYFNVDVGSASAETTDNYYVDNEIGAPKAALQDDDNPKLVHLIFETAFNENRQRLISFENIKDKGGDFLQLLNTAFTYDTDRPGIDEVEVVDQNTLIVHFDEQVDITSAEAINNYSVNNDIGTPASATLQTDNKSVQLIFSTDFENEVENIVSIKGIRDLAMNEVTTTRNIDFIYDVLAPRLSSLKVVSPTQIQLTFSETLNATEAESTTNYLIDNSLGNPLTATLSARNTNQVILEFASLGNNAVNTLTITGLADKQGNTLSTGITSTFASNEITIGAVSVLTDSTLRIQFSKTLTTASAENVGSYTSDNGLTVKSVQQDAMDASLVLLTFNEKMSETLSYQLGIASLTDTDGNMATDLRESFIYDAQLESIMIINENTIRLNFDNALDASTAELMANYVIDNGLGNPLSAVLNDENPLSVTLIFATDLMETTAYQLEISGLTDSFGDLIPASSQDLIYDITPPAILSISSAFTNEIIVSFDETIDEGTAQTLNHYSLDNGIGNPSSAVLAANQTEVLLTFSSDLTNMTDYTLTINRVEDQNGNAIENQQGDFTFTAPINPEFRELVINEIYPDPDVSSPLPNVEFVEIFNRSSSIINLRDFEFTDNSSTATLSDYELAAGAYLILTSSSNAHMFESFGEVMGVSGFPSLSNSGETLFLKRRDSQILDSLQYDLTFYNDAAKDNGGYTIELINPEAPCFDSSNYAASTSGNQGSPGTQNAVFNNTPDTTAPELLSLKVTSDQQLSVTFNESMDVGSIAASDFTISGGVTVADIEVQDEFGTQVLINLAAAFERGIEFTLTITDLNDCAGNANTEVSEVFFLGGIPTANEIIITEIMADPSPSQGLPEVEYIEVYNASSKILSLDGLTLSDLTATTNLPNVTFGAGEYLVLTANSNTDEFTGINVAGVSGFPSLNTSGDSLAIADASDNLIFDVIYSQDFYRDEAKEDGGFSLEMINPEATCFDDANWTATNNTSGGTPGLQNSVFDNTPDTTAPELAEINVISDQQLSVTFNESMDVGSIAASDFTISGGVAVADIEVQDEFGTQVLINLTTAFERGVEFILTVADLNDCAGNAITEVSEVFFLGGIPTANEIIITEIMADPAPSQGLPEVEYIEILNVSGRILSLQGISLSDRTSSTLLPAANIAPGAYAILTTNSGAAQLTDAIGVSGFPSLNTSGDDIMIGEGIGEIFSVSYTDDWYRDSNKASGGFSLEMIDTAFPCQEANNWIASTSNTGGTPGSVNSVADSNPDLVGPRLVQAVALTDQTVLLTYDERLEINSLTINSFSISNGINVTNFTVSSSKKAITLTTDASLLANTPYTVSSDNITDCSGNLITSGFESQSLVIAVTAEAGDILINEILFNPLSGGVRFVELYNNSANFINLKNWLLAGASTDRDITADEVIMAPGEYLTLTTDIDVLSAQYPRAQLENALQMNSFPSFPNSEGTVAVISENDVLIDLFDYSEDFHSALLDDVDGVSLERIRFTATTNDRNNWQSASSTEGFATPGYLNSQSQQSPNQNMTVNIEPKAFAPDVAGMANFTTINFIFDNPGNTLNVKIYDAGGNFVQDIAQNALVGTEGFFRWDGTYQNGSKARVGSYMIVFEIISPEGTVSLRKELVAIGTRF
jgi:hypothetical protein